MTQTNTKPTLPLASAASLFLLQRLPSIRRAVWRTLYNTTHKHVTAGDFVFMNLGYAGADDSADSGPFSVDHFPRRLYERVVAQVDIAGKDVLEVGCGRGGGAAHVHATFAPKHMVGVDLSPIGIERCRVRHQRPGLSFQEGDAMKLPFPAGNFDAVINVESSHCYPSRERFFAEVRRVLRPGGHFMFADVFWPHLDSVSVADVVHMLHESGLSIVEEENISREVLRSRDIMAADPAFEQTLNRWTPANSLNARARSEAYALPGSYHYQSLADGRASYRRWVLQKPLTES